MDVKKSEELFLFQAGDKCGQTEALCVMVEEANGLENLEALQNHENELIYQTVYNFIEKYFGDVCPSFHLPPFSIQIYKPCILFLIISPDESRGYTGFSIVAPPPPE